MRRGVEVRHLFTHLCRHKEKTNLGVPNRWNLKPLPDFDSEGGGDDHLFSVFPPYSLLSWAMHSFKLLQRPDETQAFDNFCLTGSYRRTYTVPIVCICLRVREIRNRENGLSCRLLWVLQFPHYYDETCWMMLGCVFCLNKSTDLQRGPFFVPTHWNKLVIEAFIEGLWGFYQSEWKELLIHTGSIAQL